MSSPIGSLCAAVLRHFPRWKPILPVIPAIYFNNSQINPIVWQGRWSFFCSICSTKTSLPYLPTGSRVSGFSHSFSNSSEAPTGGFASARGARLSGGFAHQFTSDSADCSHGIKSFGAHPGTVANTSAAKQAKRILKISQSLYTSLITTIEKKSQRL